MDSLRICLTILFTASLVPAEHVRGTSGQTVTLPCTYSVSSGTTSMCWGRGECSLNKCNNEIIWTDGKRVTQRKSERYRLLGNMAEGNVSLTIHGVTTRDSGTYCCRVEIPGIFNDDKNKITLDIQEDRSRTTTTTTRTTATTFTTTYKPSVQPSAPTTPPQNKGSTSTLNPYIFDQDITYEDNQTYSAPAGPREDKDHTLPIILGCTVLVIITAAIIIYKCRSRKPQISDVPMQTALENTDNRAADNIYIME